MQAVVIGKPSERRGVGALEGYRGGGAVDRCALCDWGRPDRRDVAIVAALTGTRDGRRGGSSQQLWGWASPPRPAGRRPPLCGVV